MISGTDLARKFKEELQVFEKMDLGCQERVEKLLIYLEQIPNLLLRLKSRNILEKLSL